jgi:polyferredoxin
MAKDLYRAGALKTLLRNPLPQRLLQWGFLVALAALIYAAWGRERLPGIDDPFPLIYTHATTLLFWVVWFMGIVLAAPLVGRLWCGVCPLGYLSDRLGRIGLNLRWPGGAFKYLPVLTVFTLGVAAALFFDAHKSPHQTAVLVGASTILAAVTGLIWKRSLFCGRLCPVGLVLSLYSRHAPLKVATHDDETCKSCTKRECASRKGRWTRWDAGTLVVHKKTFSSGCPVALDPPTMDNNQCLLCMECVRSCPNGNLGLFAGGAPNAKRSPLTGTGAMLLPFLAGLVALALVRTWPALRDAVAPGAYPATEVWGLWFGAVLPLVFLLAAPLAVWLGERTRGRDVDLPTPKNDGEAEEKPGPTPKQQHRAHTFWQLAGRLCAPFAGLVLGGHAALALVKLNAKVSYLPYLFYDPLGSSTYQAINIAGTLDMPELLIPLEVVKYLAFALLALGTFFGVREIRWAWLGSSTENDGAGRINTAALLLALVGFGALLALYGATLYHWLFMGR